MAGKGDNNVVEYKVGIHGESGDKEK